MRRATLIFTTRHPAVRVFLSTLSLRRATNLAKPGKLASLYFYPRSPCGERLPIYTRQSTATEFLSTLSLRRATCYSLRHSASRGHFYPRSPCGERLDLFHVCTSLVVFLSTLSGLVGAPLAQDFYPRSPCGERQSVHKPLREYSPISIHALLAESDRIKKSALSVMRYFYPRSPCGERPGKLA